MDVKVAPQQYIAPVAPGAHGGPAGSQPVFPTPVWVTVVRGFQLFLAFVIMVLAGMIIHGLALDAVVFGLVCGLFTFIVAIYALVTEKVPSAHGGYNYWAILSLDLFLVIFWLASMGANAALRASFIYNVTADCYDDGSAINSGHCIVSRNSLGKRVAAVAGRVARDEMSAIAGLSALEMILFIASLAHLAHQVRLHLEAKKKSAAADPANVEMKMQAQPMLNPNAPPPHPQPAHPHYADNMGYGAQGYPPQQPQPYAGQQQSYGQAQAAHQQAQYPAGQPAQYPAGQPHYSQSPTPELYSQQPQYQSQSPTPELYSQQQPQYQHQHPHHEMYSPAATPVQQPPYHPPPQ